MKGVPINLDKKGCLDLISSSDSAGKMQAERGKLIYLFSILEYRLSFLILRNMVPHA